jgi:hypothetical protein
MKATIFSACRVLLSLLCFVLLSLTAQQQDGLKILQAESPFTIDGDLADWASIAEFPVQLTVEDKVLPASADLTVMARFSFDSKYFYAALRVIDDRIEFPDMRRREGDGCYLAFISPGAAASSDGSVIFGFSRFGDEAIALIDRPGEEGLSPARDVQFQLKWNESLSTVSYELAIPWSYIPYFRPFFQQKFGINLSYDDAGGSIRLAGQDVPVDSAGQCRIAKASVVQSGDEHPDLPI